MPVVWTIHLSYCLACVAGGMLGDGDLGAAKGHEGNREELILNPTCRKTISF